VEFLKSNDDKSPDPQLQYTSIQPQQTRPFATHSRQPLTKHGTPGLVDDIQAHRARPAQHNRQHRVGCPLLLKHTSHIVLLQVVCGIWNSNAAPMLLQCCNVWIFGGSYADHQLQLTLLTDLMQTVLKNSWLTPHQPAQTAAGQTSTQCVGTCI
jgi:hypothetical protein